MKHCIWCNRTELITTFNTKAHIFPESLGGKNLCFNVCDDCNWKFGQKQQFQPSVDIALKEIFNLKKYLLQDSDWINRKNKSRFKSEYFNLNIDKRKITIKPSYKFKSEFQANFARSFRRGIYKIYLEERERIFGDGKSEEFNFIREFSRYNLNDIPLYYLKPKVPIILVDKNQFVNPEMKFTKYNKKLHEEFRLFHFYYGGYDYILHTNNFMKEIHINKYLNSVIKNDPKYQKLSNLIQINTMEDLDFRFEFFSKK